MGEKNFFFLRGEEAERIPLPGENKPLRAPPGVYYRCVHAFTCAFGVDPDTGKDYFWRTCAHAKVHKRGGGCTSTWRKRLNPRVTDSYGFSCNDGVRRTVKDCNCIAHLDKIEYPKNFGKPKVHKPVRLIKKIGPVICPAAMDSCKGKCSHAEPHTQNKYCADQVTNGEVRIQCVQAKKDGRPRSSRSLLVGGYDLECHKR